MHAEARCGARGGTPMSSLTEQLNVFFTQFSAAWQTHDGAALGRWFAEDGSLINPFGERAEGRSAVAAMYANYFKGMLAGTTTTVSLSHARAVAGDYAFADGE